MFRGPNGAFRPGRVSSQACGRSNVRTWTTSSKDWSWNAIDGLPAAFRDRLGSVAIVIEAEATPDQLRSVSAHGLYGLYQGIPRTTMPPKRRVPSKITLFSGPLLRASRSLEELAERVTDTVYHEIAHHFGISDARLRELQAGH